MPTVVIADDSPTHILTELAQRVRGAVTGRQVHLILENDENEAKRLVREAKRLPLRELHHIVERTFAAA